MAKVMNRVTSITDCSTPIELQNRINEFLTEREEEEGFTFLGTSVYTTTTTRWNGANDVLCYLFHAFVSYSVKCE